MWTFGVFPWSERRLAAILVADVVGFTARVAEDESAALRAIIASLQVLRTVVALNVGLVVKSLGDGALAELVLSSTPSTLQRRCRHDLRFARSAGIEAALAADGVILGPTGMTAYPDGEPGWLNLPGTIRKRLTLFANIRPRPYPSRDSRCTRGLDWLIVHENTEGFYSDRNLFAGTDDARRRSSIRKITRPGEPFPESMWRSKRARKATLSSCASIRLEQIPPTPARILRR